MIFDNLGTLLGHNVWQSIVIFGVVFAILKIIKNTSAEEKSWSWSATLFALALLPMAAFLPGKGIELNHVPETVLSSPADGSMLNDAGQNELAKSKTKAKFTKISKPAFTLPSIDKNDFLSAFLVIWLLGTVAALLRLIYAGYNASKLRQNAYPFAGIDDKDWPVDMEIAISDKISGPIVIGVFKPLILIPRGFAFEMDQSELKPLLYHELAHVKRRDNMLHFIERIIIAFYWWNPVMHYIAARIAEERELACDDRAASSCGDSLIYAKSLLKGARKLIANDKPILGLAVLRRESVLSKRVKRLTSCSALEDLNVKRLIKNLSAISVAILFLCLVTPRIAVGQNAINKNELNSVEMFRDGLFLEVEWKGNIILDDQDANIIDLSDNGYFSLVTEEDGMRKELVLRNDGEAVENSFLENGIKREMSAEDITWQKNTLVDMLRLSGINAEERVDRIYRDGGVESVIDEISKMHSDYAMRLYAEALVDIYELEQDDIQRLIIIVSDMESDYEKNLTLASIADEQELDGKTVELLASAAPDSDEGFKTLVEFEPISEQEREEIKREIERELENLLSEEELSQAREEALSSLPSEEELAEMRRQALESFPSEEELKEMRAEALASMPTVEELKKIHAEALADMPTEDELAAIIKDALAEVPSAEELEKIRENAIAGLPTAEELEQMRNKLREQLEKLPHINNNSEIDVEIQEELSRLKSDIIIDDIHEHVEMSIELSATADEMARIGDEVAESLLGIHIEIDELNIEQ